MNNTGITKGEIGLFVRYLHPYRIRLFKISALAIVCALFEAVNLGALVPLIQLLNTGGEPGGTLWNILKTTFSVIGLELTFINLLLVMAILFIIGQVLLYIKKQAQARLWFLFSADLKRAMFSTLLYADIDFHYGEKSGKFIDLLNRQTEYAATAIFAATEIVTYVFFIVVYTILLLYISVELTGICLIIAFLSLIFLNSLINRSKDIGIRSNETNIRMNEFVTERLGLIKLIRIFSSEKEEIEKFDRFTRDYMGNNTDFWMNGVKIETIFQIIIFSIAIAILYVATLVLSLPLAMLLVFIFILIRLTDPLRQINAKRHDLAGQLAVLDSIDRTFRDLGRSQTIVNGSKQFIQFDDNITFTHVCFSYVPSNPVLDDISFSIRKNEMVALVGASGAGKSTIADLIIRLMDPTKGRIHIDGADIRDFDLNDYHKKIGFVSQESYLFNDTIRNNISYGTASFSQERIILAAKIANAHEFIMQLPNGYDTEIGERGVKLSGGQKQRIALARALYKDPQILILDEATSSLDPESEKVIQQSILAIKNKYTIIAIAHRLSTIEKADRIVVIERGKIIETGKHAELVALGGLYAKYYDMQHQTATNNRPFNGADNGTGGTRFPQI